MFIRIIYDVSWRLLQACDTTLLNAAEAGTDKHPASGNDFKRVTRILRRHQPELPPSCVKLLFMKSKTISFPFNSYIPSKGEYESKLLEYESRYHAS
jgi:hypothetical protein